MYRYERFYIIQLNHKIQKRANGFKGLLLLLMVLFNEQLFAGTPPPDNINETLLDEMYVSLTLQGFGKFNINAVYSSDSVYLSVVDVFQQLKINQNVSLYYDTISGFFINPDTRYIINYTSQSIKITDRIFNVTKRDLVKTENGLFLSLEMFGKAFGLFCKFNPRSMSVTMQTALELPIFKEMKQTSLRNNLKRLSGIVEVDTTLFRIYHRFKKGMADWMLSSTQDSKDKPLYRAKLALGTELFNGEADVFFNFYSKSKFELNKQIYIWRWVDNNDPLMKQFQLGSINSGSISTINTPILGTMLTNTPTKYRGTYGKYTLSNFTQPGWTVELYVNNVLIDYVTTDASGFYSFDIPLVYGYSIVKIKYFGLYGEEQIKEEFINLPYTFLPKGEFEYIIKDGLVQDGNNSWFTRAELNYGINQAVTAGGGAEYFSFSSKNKIIPFLNTSSLIYRRVLFNAEFAYGVRAKTSFIYRTPSNMCVKLDYQNYVNGQKAITYNYGDELNFTFTEPYKMGKRNNGYLSLALGKKRLAQNYWYNTSQLIAANYFGRFSTNIQTFARWINKGSPIYTINLSANYRIDNNYMVRTQSQMEVNKKQVSSIVVSLERRLSNRGYIRFSYESSFMLNYRGFSFGLFYDLAFAQTNSYSTISNKSFVTTQSASGSLAYDQDNRYTYANTHPTVGKGCLTIIPFLDINHNGNRDLGEPLVEGLNVRVEGARILEDKGDTLIRIGGMELYTSYLVRLEDKNFENVSWKLKLKIISVYGDPNQFKQIEVPIYPMGEVYGIVYLKTKTSDRGVGRIMVDFYNEQGKLFQKTMSESDGYFSFMGLSPGKYTAKLEKEQMKNLNMNNIPDSIPFTILPMASGDAAKDLKFILSVNETIVPPKDIIQLRPVVNPTEADSVILEGKVLEKGTNHFVFSKMEILDLDSNKVILHSLSSIDSGTFRIKLPCRKVFGIEVKAKGYLFFIDRIKISASTKQHLYQQNFLLEKIKAGTKVVLNNIFFENGKTTLTPASFEELLNVVRLLEENSEMRVEIGGHSDNIGTPEINKKLSGERAKAVVDYLVSRGIDGMRIEFKGYESEQPVAPNNTAKARKLNRRVEFKVLSN